MAEKKNLPVTQTQEKRLKIIAQEDQEQYLRLQMFQMVLHRSPNEKKLKTKSVGTGKSVKYLPIGQIEMMLDQDYFGLWSTEKFTVKVIANEICGELILKVFHPVAQVWIERIGAGAVQIQMKSEKDSQGNKIATDITDITKKIQNTLEKDYPHLKAQCIRNAAQSLGAKYGRNLNRADVDSYSGLMKDEEAEKEKKHEDLKS